MEITRVLWKKATTPREVTPTDYVPKEIEVFVAKFMKKWDDYLAQDHKAHHQEDFYIKAKTTDDDAESQKFFDLKLTNLADTCHQAKSNALCMNSKVH